MRRKKEELTLEQWIALGNKAKEIREGIRDLMSSSQMVCDSKTYEILCKALHHFNMWRSEMDNIVCGKIEDNIATRIFYGDAIEEYDRSNV